MTLVGDLLHWLSRADRQASNLESDCLRLPVLDLCGPQADFCRTALRLSEALLEPGTGNQRSVQLLHVAKAKAATEEAEWRLRLALAQGRVCWARDERELALNALKEAVEEIQSVSKKEQLAAMPGESSLNSGGN